MSGSLRGSIFRVMTFGESHGPYIGVVVDGLQPGLPIDAEAIQVDMDRRKPGQSDVVTPRKEEDQVQIVSGVFEGKTTGAPMCMLIKNKDQRSRDYGNLKNIYRPGHASFTFLKKFGIFDYRGGGRASGRETACRVAAGAVAKQMLAARGIEIRGFTRQVADIRAESVDFDEIERNVVRAPDAEAAKRMEAAILAARDEQDSLGGVIEVVVRNSPAGLGEPVFDKLEADLAGALMSIGAVKAFEMGSGFRAATLKGSQSNDEFEYDAENDRFRTRTNNSGGVLGGITNGEDLVMRITVKPPSSIGKAQMTVDHQGKETEFSTGGRHDPCICPRVVPVAEAMVALVLIDHMLMQERITAKGNDAVLQDKINTIDTQMLLLQAQRRQLVERLESGQPKAADDAWRQQARELDLDDETIDLLGKLMK